MKNPLSGVDTSKKHGTNSNFMKSGMKNADGTASSGAPFLGGIGRKILDPLGLFGKGKGGRRGACPPSPMQPPPARPAEPTGTPAPAAAAAPAPAPAAEEAQPAATMKKDLLRDKVVEGRKKKVKKDNIMDVKPPNYKPNRDKLEDPNKKTITDRKGGGALPDPRMVKKKVKKKVPKDKVIDVKPLNKAKRYKKRPKTSKLDKVYGPGAPMTEGKKVRKDNIMDAKPPNWKPNRDKFVDPRKTTTDAKDRRPGGVIPDPRIKKKTLRDIKKEKLVGPRPKRKIEYNKLKKKGAPNMKTGSYSQKFEK